MLKKYSLIAIILFGLCICLKISAQEAKKTATAKPKEDVIGRADKVKSVWGDKKTVLLQGNVKFVQGDTAITCDEVFYDQDNKIAESKGKLSITNPKSDIVGDKGWIYFKKKIGVVEGSVVMSIKPETESALEKDSVDAKLDQPTKITCAKLEYDYKNKVISAVGGVVFSQTKRTANADKAIYDQRKELLTLSGNVKGTDEDGQTFSSPEKVVISLKKGDEWMEAPNANITFKIDTDE